MKIKIFYLLVLIEICTSILILPNSKYDDNNLCINEHDIKQCKNVAFNSTDYQCCVENNHMEI